MADHKFVYTVSGVNLSDAQKTAISQEIGAAVARVLVGASPKPVISDCLNICKIHGGLMIPNDLVANVTVADILAKHDAR
jgi:hypothetical protein